MKLSRFIEKNPLEVLLAVLLIIFILSPIQPPGIIANTIDSTLGIVIVSFLIVYLFVYSHTILAILFVIAIFELVRRSSARKQHQPAIVTYTALQPSIEPPPQPPVEYEPAVDSTSVPTTGKNMAVPRKEQLRRDQDMEMLHQGGIGMNMGVDAMRENISAGMNAGVPIGMAPMMGGYPRPQQTIGRVPRMGAATGPQPSDFMDFEMSQAVRDREMMEMNTKLMEVTLEEELVHSMPTPAIEQDYLDNSFKPVYDNIRQASPF